VEIRLSFELLAAARPTNSREAFWREYIDQSTRDDYSEGEDDSSLMESRLYSGFLPEINRAIRRHFHGRDAGGDGLYIDLRTQSLEDMRSLTLTIARIDYHSLEMVLSVLGLSDGALLPAVAAALEIYGPDSFYRAFPQRRQPALRASAQVVGVNFPNVQSTVGTETKTEGALSRIWAIANTSLLVPVLLTLAVLYVAFGAVSDESKELHRERTALQASLTDFTKAMLEQDRDLAQTNSRSANDIANVMKELRKVQMDGLKSKPSIGEAPPAPSEQQSVSGGCLLAIWCRW
jgi:hypothetical protein